MGRWIGSLLVTLAALGAIAAGVAHQTPAAGARAAARPAPVLVLVRRNPLTVQGRHFSARTPVRLRLIAAHTVTRRVTADGHGTFTVAFPVVDRCSSFSVLADQRGHAGVVLHGPRPQCAPAVAP